MQGQPFRGTAVADLYDSGMPGLVGTMVGAKLTGGGAAATAQLVDANGTVLADLACAIGAGDYADIPVQFVRKVRLGAISGAGAIVNVWIL